MKIDLIPSILSPGNSTIELNDYNWPVLSLSVFSLFGIFGNILVCLTVKRDQALQTKTNFYLFSLAIADLAVCAFVLPLSIIQDFSDKWIFSIHLCTCWIFSDILLCTSSIYHLSAVSVLRFIAIQYPLKSNRTTSYKITFFIIFLIWTISILLSSLIIYLGYIDFNNVIDLENKRCMLKNDKFIIYGSIFCFVIPLLIMILMFFLMTRKLRQQLTKLNNSDLSKCTDNILGSRKKSYDLRANSVQRKKYSHSFERNLYVSRKERNTSTLHPSSFDTVIQSFEIPYKCNISNDIQLRRHAPSNFKESIASIISNRHSNFTQVSFQRQLTIDSLSSKSKNRDSMYKNSIFFKNYEIKNVILNHLNQIDMQNEFKALQVLGIVFIAFLIAWLPFCLVNIISAIYSIYKKDAIHLHKFLNYLTYLGYFQSTFNPIIYTIFNQKFRKNFIQILKCSKSSKKPKKFYVTNNFIYTRK